jgi:hypothetical protein
MGYNFAKHFKQLRWRTPFQAICETWAKDPTPFKINPHHLIPGPYTPIAARFHGHVVAAGGHHLFDHAQAERKAEVEPNGVADDFARKAIAGIAGANWRYRTVRLGD